MDETGKEVVKRVTGFEPYGWQLNVGEVLWLRINCLVIAGTGSGKSIPFVMPILTAKEHGWMIWIISPLREFQKDHVCSPFIDFQELRLLYKVK
jgi:superfamily II DNA helicase RecQ